jgi:chromate transport protein ChrA
VVPLLREYVVAPGWVSARDFLIGLAIIQAMPGPNFNCNYLVLFDSLCLILTSGAVAVYLGALTLAPTRTPSVVGALLGYIAIFAPGIVLAMGFQSIWSVLRSRPAVVALLRGVNAAAVGLVFTAVYRLWEIGYLTPGGNAGLSLGNEPWWVVVAALAFTSTAWFGVETWMAILAGSVLGLCWFGVVRP